MYTFKDKGDRSMALRPEGTAPVVRSYIENKMYGDPNQPIKVFYNQPMFRYERQQKGRYSQFVQFGVEAIGVEDPLIDVESVSKLMAVHQSCGLRDRERRFRPIGELDSRKEYQKALQEHFSPRIDEFCDDWQSRTDTTPMRILDRNADKDDPLL